jgi:predicted NBD/HSP70 family sugar kinase
MRRRPVKAKHRVIAQIEAELLRRVRARGGLSRVELARELNLVPSTAGIYVDRLVREGFLIETEKVARTPGRPAKLLAPNPDGGQFVGVDFEARNIMTVAVDFSQQPLRRAHRAIRGGDDVDAVIEKLEDAIREVMAGDPRPLLGIGVGVPGTVDSSGAMALDYAYLPGWHNVPLADRLRGRLHAPVHLENNIRSMALAEMWFGGGRGLRNFVCLGVRTGIAAGIISQGQLLTGAQGRAGEIGGWPTPPPSGTLAEGGGKLPTLESIASLPATLKAASRVCGRTLDFSGLKHAVEQREASVISALSGIAAIHGLVAAQLALLLDPQRIILVGPLAELGEAFLQPLRDALNGFLRDDAPEVVSSTLGGFSGAIGAAALALHQWKPVR